MTARGLIVVMIGCALALACLGCSQPADRRVVEVPLAEEDIVGEWHPTEDTLAMLASKGHERTQQRPYTVDLRPDGSCDFDTLLDRLHGNEHVSAPCTWSLQHDAFGNTNLRSKNVLRITLEGQGAMIQTYLYFVLDAEELVMMMSYGDPDRRERIEYERG